EALAAERLRQVQAGPAQLAELLPERRQRLFASLEHRARGGARAVVGEEGAGYPRELLVLLGNRNRHGVLRLRRGPDNCTDRKSRTDTGAFPWQPRRERAHSELGGAGDARANRGRLPGVRVRWGIGVRSDPGGPPRQCRGLRRERRRLPSPAERDQG